jgi:CHAD domain-containing protein
MKWDDSISVAQNTRQRLPRQLEKFYAAGRDAAAQDDPALLHKFRLEAKRVRYTLELFRPAYGPGLEIMLQALRRVQNALGEIQDCAAARLVDDPAFRKWADRHQRKLIGELRKHWAGEFDAPGEERRWLRYLKTAKRSGPGHQS